MTTNPHARRLAKAAAIDDAQREVRLAQQAGARRTDHPTLYLPAEHVTALAEAFDAPVVDAIDGHIGALLVTLDGRGVHLVSEGPVHQCRGSVVINGRCIGCDTPGGAA